MLMMQASGMVFDANAYWRERLESNPTLESTGTRPFGLSYQRYLYRLKEAAVRRVMRRVGRTAAGTHVLNVACGWGYFEPVFDAWGAASVTGMDLVEPAIRALRRRYPKYLYVAGDIAASSPPTLAGREFDIVTAMDVLYHLTDEENFTSAVRNLCAFCKPGGMLIWTDAPHRDYDPTHPHCRYRSWERYASLLAESGLEIVATTPMYHLFDTYADWSEWAARHPRLIYPAMYTFDRCCARFGRRATSNNCALAVRR